MKNIKDLFKLLFVSIAFLAFLTACENGDQDAEDLIEDAEEAVEDAGEAVGETAEDAADAVEDAADEY